ncbi:hemin-degrading factor [Arenibacterium halophilum]|uniref:Hemin-degrading factor n=1 Tax=Arenibacterium halophilum TaxID=2583821 RepID=A0ABY2X9I3_9RHOB|nr:ChuX/HutX family heme-like substrate-binding protein [Arenibacterium halophilum]TMV13034.1 hemin-degrading factor [Arenibacterium halophilum]
MTDTLAPARTAAEIRAQWAAQQGRARDIAHQLGLREAQLIAARIGHGATAIAAHPDRLFPALGQLGTCMALTRNESCVIEIDGRYENFHAGEHAAMTLEPGLDMRMFPRHWVHGFAFVEDTDTGPRRSIQVFDAAGDAIHKVYLRPASDLDGWDRLVTELALPEQADVIAVDDRAAPEGAKSAPEKRDILLSEWRRLTDTHQFLRLCAKLKMNRLGAYRIAGDEFVRPLSPAAIPAMMQAVQASGAHVMTFVGNAGCIEIHSGPFKTLKAMGPWENVLDPGFNLHLRQDHVAEVWAVEKPTKRGNALSFEAFDAQGNLIFQVFPVAKEANDHRAAWAEIVATLPGADA